MIDPAAREQIDKVLGPSEREMLARLDDGELVPIDGATRVRAYRIRQALSLLSPATVVICARGVGYTLRRLDQ